MRDAEYYKLAARLNLLNTSRTAECGEIDISVSGEKSNYPTKISKETMGECSSEQIKKLQAINEKANNLELDNLKNLSQEEIKQLTVNNFNNAIQYMFNIAQSIVSDNHNLEILNFEVVIENIAKMIGEGIVKADKWFREHDSRKFPYTKTANLKQEYSKFCQQFIDKIKNRPQQEPEIFSWVTETAAWVEYRINLTDHYFTDSCGKVAAAMSAFVCMLANHPLPVFTDKNDNFLYAPKRPRDVNKVNEDEDKQYKKWKEFYITKFIDKLQNNDSISNNINEENKKEYYKRNALDNLAILSKSSKTGAASATGYEGKESQLKKLTPIEVRSLVFASFSALIDELYQKRNDKIDEKYLEELIKTIVYQLNEKSLDINVNDPIEKFFRDKDGNYPYVSHELLSTKFSQFLKEIVERINNQQNYDSIATIALVHYRIFLNYHFFKDGNQRIALALVTYICMRLNLKLPQFSVFDKRERHYAKEKITTDDIGKDPQFSLWLAFYKSLFLNPQKSIGVENTFDDGWDITIEKVLDKRFTIYECGLRSFEEVEEMKKATGYEAKKLIVFKPDRMLRHELIIYTKTHLKFDDKNIVNNLIDIIVKFFKDESILRNIQLLDTEFLENKKAFENYISYVVEDYFHAANVDEDLQKRIRKFSDDIQKRIKEGKCNIKLSESKELMKKLIVDDLLRDFLKSKTRKIVEDHFQTPEIKANYTPLILKENFQRAAWAIVGGPAAGKSSLKKEVYEQIKLEDGCCVVNPDDYKPLLVTNNVQKDNQRYAALVHEESSYVTDGILQRLKEMVENNKAPNILLDIVTSSDSKMAIAGYGGATVYLNIASCPVEGEEGAVNRAFARAKDQSPQNEDRNRYVPTQVILHGHKEESVLLPETIEKFKVNLRLFDTNVGKRQPPKLVAVIDTHNKQLKIYEPQSFYQFIKKALLNEKAACEEQAYTEDITGEVIAELFLSYLNKGIELFFMYGQENPHPKVIELNKMKKELEDKIKGDSPKTPTSNEGSEDEEKLQFVKQKIKQFKKESTFAIFSLERGIICNNFEALCKIFPENLGRNRITQELLYYFILPILKEKNTLQNMSLHLYDSNGHCFLKRDDLTKFQLEYDSVVLKKTCPIIFQKTSPNLGIVESLKGAFLPIVNDLEQHFSEKENAQKYLNLFESLANNPNVIASVSRILPMLNGMQDLFHSFIKPIQESSEEEKVRRRSNLTEKTKLEQAKSTKLPSYHPALFMPYNINIGEITATLKIITPDVKWNIDPQNSAIWLELSDNSKAVNIVSHFDSNGYKDICLIPGKEGKTKVVIQSINIEKLKKIPKLGAGTAANANTIKSFRKKRH